jgi:hypothetical protein
MLRAIALVAALSLVTAAGAFAEKSLVRVYFDDQDHIRQVVSQFEDVAGWGGKRYADIVIPSELYGELAAVAPNHEILIPRISEHMARQGVLGVGGYYHTYEEVYDDMDSVATAYPGLCQLQSIGQSIEGREIWALKISDNVSVTEDEPKVLYLGCHHAREVISVEIPLHIMYWLVSNYGSDPKATSLVDEREIWIVPLMNPDGREYVEHTGDWRKNRRNNGDGTRGVDLNRNWGYMWGYDDIGSSPNTSSETYRGTGPFSEPETQVIRDLMLNYPFDTCISYHSHGRLVLYPFGYAPIMAPDHAIFEALADSMVTFNNYAPGPGISLYPVNGDSDDWMYGEQLIKDKVFSYTYEVGTEFYPPSTAIDSLCEKNLEPSLLAAVYAGRVAEILPPGTPVIDPMGDDADGDYVVSWSPDRTDTVNPAVEFALTERTGPSRLTDDVEAGDIHWIRSQFRLSTTRAYSGVQSFWGGRTNSRDARLTSLIALDVGAGDTLDFWTWYDIEDDWDYAYVEVSSDGGATFYSIPGNITTTYNPNGNNLGHGITGNSGGWVHAYFPLGGYADSTAVVRFRYKTDSYVLEDGIYIDDIYPVQDFDSTVVLSESIPDTLYSASNPIGTYYYEVRAKDDDGQWGYWSQREAITVTGAGVHDIPGEDLALRFKNPVYAGSSVKLSAPGLAGASVLFYDIQGRVVRKLNVPASGDVTWDLRDASGSPVSPGIYFARSGRADGTAARKIVVLR